MPLYRVVDPNGHIHYIDAATPAIALAYFPGGRVSVIEEMPDQRVIQPRGEALPAGRRPASDTTPEGARPAAGVQRGGRMSTLPARVLRRLR